jgi:capsular exopolysaccharide synthesis family protein
MELLSVIKMLLRWWWLIALSAFIGAFAGFQITQQIAPIYQASASFIVTVRSGDIRPDEQRMVASTYLQLAYQRPVLEEVIERLNLDMSVPELERIIDANFVQNDTLLLRVSVEDTSPQRAAAIANEVVSVLSEQGRVLLNSDQRASRALLQEIEVALPPRYPIEPSPTRNIMLGFVVGGMVASGGLFLWGMLNTTIRSDEHVHMVTGLDTFVSLPRASSLPFNTMMPTLSEPASAMTETYRLLRARIEHSAGETPVRSLVMTSSLPQEGKSTIIANLAVVLAQSGKRVILVDANLRQPILHKSFKHPNPETGLSTVLAQPEGTRIADYLLATQVDGLSLLPAGKDSTNPADLIGSQRMQDVCQQLTTLADIVLIDSPPMLSAIDAALLARISDGTVLVVQAGATHADELSQAKTQLDKFGVRLLGAVINGVPEKLASFRKDVHRKPRRSRVWKRPQAAQEQADSARGERGNFSPEQPSSDVA